MLRKSRRITTREFDKILKGGRVVHAPLFIVRYVASAGPGPSRLAAVAPVKIAKTSVERHRIRRRIYEAARTHMGSLPAGASVIVFAKPGAAKADIGALRASLGEIFVKAGLLR